MTPKIDYKILGEALSLFEERGFVYAEVPWVVPDKVIRATLPHQFDYFEQVMEDRDSAATMCKCPTPKSYTSKGGLVGSAEQGFLALDLPPGKYVGVSPCFRDEYPIDLMRRPYFMKVELFVTDPAVTLESVIYDAESVMMYLGDVMPVRVETAEGIDLEIAGVEVGSYGAREVEGFGKWIYGTGLALPRFTVAKALDTVL